MFLTSITAVAFPERLVEVFPPKTNTEDAGYTRYYSDLVEARSGQIVLEATETPRQQADEAAGASGDERVGRKIP